MIKDIVYIIDILNIENIEKIEEFIRGKFNVKFLAYDQYELKVVFINELTEYEENILFNCIMKVKESF